MNDFFNNLLAALSAAAPTALWIGRICMTVIAVWLLIRCARSLFSGKREPEVWGFLSLSNGARYDLTHWENVIGRARSCDVRISFPSVSRSHAAVCRGDDGVWQVYPLNQSSGVLLNGKHIFSPTRLQAGDSIAVGGVELYFFPANHEEELRQAERRSRPGHTVSAAGSLWLLSIFQVLTFMQFLPVCTEDYFPKIVLSFAAVGAAGWALYGLYRAMQRTAYELETLVFFLITLGIAVMSAYAPSSLFKQLIAIALGIALFLLLGTALRSLRLAQQLRWPVAAAAAALLAFNVLFGQRIFGAKNWISIGPLSLQPSELVKIAFILAGAATLDRLFAKRNLIFTVLFSAYCVGCLALMSDFGTALVFFVAFLCIAFLRTGDLPSIVMMTAAAGFAGGLMLHFKPYIADRFTVWRHAWEFAQSTGYQQTRTMSAVASGGLFGAGPTDAWLKYVGAANTDLVFGVVSEEFGLLLALCARRGDHSDCRVRHHLRRHRPLELLYHRLLRSGRDADRAGHAQHARLRRPAPAHGRHVSVRVDGRLEHALVLEPDGLPQGRRHPPERELRPPPAEAQAEDEARTPESQALERLFRRDPRHPRRRNLRKGG